MAVRSLHTVGELRVIHRGLGVNCLIDMVREGLGF
jgi:hypothetical protein